MQFNDLRFRNRTALTINIHLGQVLCNFEGSFLINQASYSSSEYECFPKYLLFHSTFLRSAAVDEIVQSSNIELLITVQVLGSQILGSSIDLLGILESSARVKNETKEFIFSYLGLLNNIISILIYDSSNLYIPLSKNILTLEPKIQPVLV